MMIVAADHGVRRTRRYGPEEPMVAESTTWRGMCVQSTTADGAENAFADDADLLAHLPGLSPDAVDAARSVLAPQAAPLTHADDAPPDGWAAPLARRHRVRLVCADYRQRVAVGSMTRLTLDLRAASTIEVIALDDQASAQVVQWLPGDPEGSAERVEDAAEAVRRLAGLPVADLPATRCDVVLDAGQAGPLFHELIGHPLEADVVRAGTSYLARRGAEHVAPSWLVVSDGPAPAGEGLTAGVDDEGTPITPTTLIEGGRVAGHLHDRLTAAGRPRCSAGPDAGVPDRPGGAGTGHGRRLDYRHPVVPRMWHTRAEIVGADPEEPDGAVRLHVRGLQLGWMNLLTGDVEFRCATGLLDAGGGPVGRTGPFTFSGNALTLLGALRPGPGAVRGGGRASRGCGKLGQYPLVTTFANGGLWLPGGVVDVRGDRGR
ncbi:MAG TPA: metallopeptidase TldD-related protein [Kineosporiaceae bacterium]